MSAYCASCKNNFDDSLPFCPYCGSLKGSSRIQTTPKKEFDIFSDETEDNDYVFSSLDEPATEYEAFKKAINDSFDQSEYDQADGAHEDLSEDYIMQNKHHNEPVDIDATFMNFYEDNDINRNGSYVPQKKKKIQSTYTDSDIKTINKTGTDIAFTYPSDHILSVIRDIAFLILAAGTSVAGMTLIMKCDNDIPFTILPFLTITFLFTAYSLLTRYFTLFDKITIPLFLLTITFFGYYLSKEYNISGNFTPFFICTSLQALNLLSTKKLFPESVLPEKTYKLIGSVVSVIPIFFFIKKPLIDSEFLLLLIFIFFNFLYICISLFPSFGIPSLICSFIPAATELVLLKYLPAQKLDETASLFIMIAAIIIPYILCVEIYNILHKDKTIELSVVNIITSIISHLLLLIIYQSLYAGAHNKYITLTDKLFTIQTGIFVIILIVCDCIYGMVKLLLKRTTH